MTIHGVLPDPGGTIWIHDIPTGPSPTPLLLNNKYYINLEYEYNCDSRTS